jgi:cell division protein FtsL
MNEACATSHSNAGVGIPYERRPRILFGYLESTEDDHVVLYCRYVHTAVGTVWIQYVHSRRLVARFVKFINDRDD